MVKPTSGFRLLTVGDFDITVDWSLFIIFGLIAVNLGAAGLPAWHPDWSSVLTWTVAVGSALLFFASILAHELSHVAVARSYGMSVDGITLFMFGGMARIRSEPPHPRAELLMAAAGPAMSIALGFGCTIVAVNLSPELLQVADAPNEEAVLAALAKTGPFATILYWIGSVNLVLGIFNLVPGFPLDGGRVLRALIWWRTGEIELATRWASRAGQVVAWTLMTAGLLMVFGMSVPFFGSGVQGLWLILIGWFLKHAAQASYQQTMIKAVLTGVPVSRVMELRFHSIEPEMSVGDFVRTVMSQPQRSFPVVEDGHLVGICSVEDVRKVDYGSWDQTSVADVMTPRARLVSVAPSTEATDALRAIVENSFLQLPVLDGERLVGFFRREDALQWVAQQAQERSA